ncbi:MAG: rod shape-determining protein RodA [Bacteroidetes bacterium]|nr:rod shape-determining protein RodA [Bacteroidota bacterium]
MRTQQGTISKGLDWTLFWVLAALALIGMLAIFAATYKEGDPLIASWIGFNTDYSKQFYFFVFSLMIGFVVLLADSKFFAATSNLGYALGILFLFLVFPFHSRIKGTESIIRIGSFNFQPAEFVKLFVALALAKYLSLPELDFRQTRAQLRAAALVLFPALLCILQSETGLALVYTSLFLVMYREGLPASIPTMVMAVVILVVTSILVPPNLLAILLTVLLLIALYMLRRTFKRQRGLFTKIILIWLLAVAIQRFAVPFLFKNVLQKHQVERIYNLFGKDNPYRQVSDSIRPAVDLKKKETGTSYNVRQSKIAIGSGRFLGKGLLRATQTRYDFVPEQRTDFIFCTVGEGFGFVGSALLLGLYLFLLLRIVTIAERQRSTFSRAYAYGVLAVIFFHVVVNIGMTIGLMPVIGIPLPWISYGGTSLITFSLMIFILMRLDADRQMVLR